MSKIPGISKLRLLSRSSFAFLHTGLRLPSQNGYHALAIDEHREAFKPTLWTKKFKDDVTPGEMAPPIGAQPEISGGDRDETVNESWRFKNRA